MGGGGSLDEVAMSLRNSRNGEVVEGLRVTLSLKFFETYICIYFFIIICFIYLAVAADVRSQTSTPLLKSRMTSAMQC